MSDSRRSFSMVGEPQPDRHIHEVVPIESVKTVVIEGTSYGLLGSLVGSGAGTGSWDCVSA